MEIEDPSWFGYAMTAVAALSVGIGIGQTVAEDTQIEIVGGYEAKDILRVAAATAVQFEDDLLEVQRTVAEVCQARMTMGENSDSWVFRAPDAYPNCEMEKRDTFSYGIRCEK